MKGQAQYFENSQLEDLAIKYSGQLPRYTSYPTAIELKPTTDLRPISDQLNCIGAAQKALSLYVHLPFCKSLCYFCACNKIITADSRRISEYLEKLETECEILRKCFRSTQPVAELHLGGGSPSYLSADQLERLVSMLEVNFSFWSSTTRSIELDPRTLTEEKAEALGNKGFKRASLGVQDFDPEVQLLLNRIQSFELTQAAVLYLRQSGIEEINLDLIYGLPAQTAAGFRRTLEQVVELQPERVALYGYAQVPWRVKVQNVFDKHPLPNPRERLNLFCMALKFLLDAGYEYIGLDHFALPDDALATAKRRHTLRRNFMGYTPHAGDVLVGIGASAISDLGEYLYQNSVSDNEYIELVRIQRLPIARALQRSRQDQLVNEIIHEIMCYGEVSIAERSDPSLAMDLYSKARRQLELLEVDNLVVLKSDRLEATDVGTLFLRNIAAAFDQYLPQALHSNRRAFSQAV